MCTYVSVSRNSDGKIHSANISILKWLERISDHLKLKIVGLIRYFNWNRHISKISTWFFPREKLICNENSLFTKW